MTVPGPLVVVDDPHDQRLLHYRDLRDPARLAAGEDGHGVFVAEGRVAVRQLLASPFPVVSLLVDDHQASAVADIVGGVRDRGAPVYVGTRSLVAATVGFPLHRGVVAIGRRHGLRPAEEIVDAVLAGARANCSRPVLAVLEGLNDHENVGALFRNAAAFGVGGVLLDPSCADPLYRRSVRVSAGHALTVPFTRLDLWPGSLHQIRDRGFAVLALAPEAAAEQHHLDHPHRSRTVHHHVDFAPLRHPAEDQRIDPCLDADRGYPTPQLGVAVLLGAEGPGLSPGALSLADAVVSIPMAPSVDSLNVATAAAIAFFALAGQGLRSTPARFGPPG